MRKGFLGSLAALAASGGLAFGQSPYPVNMTPVMVPGYNVPVYMPTYPMAPAPMNAAPRGNILQTMPQGYAQPYAPGGAGVAVVQQISQPQPQPMAPAFVPGAQPHPVYQPMVAFPQPVSAAALAQDKGPVLHGWPPSTDLISMLRAKSAPATGLAPQANADTKPAAIATKAAVAPTALGRILRTGGVQDAPVPNVLPDGPPTAVIPLPGMTGPGVAVPGPEWTQTPPPMTDPCPGTPLICATSDEQRAPYDVNGDHPLPDRDYRGYRGYLQSDALFWNIRRSESPTLITSTTIVGTTRSISDRDIGDNEFRGNRTTLGVWLNSEKPIAIEGSYFFLGQRNQSVTDRDATIFRPFMAVANDPTGAVPPLQISGITPTGLDLGPATATVRHFTRMWGVEANVRYEWLRGCFGHVDVLTGFRYINLDENLNIETDQVSFLTSPLITNDNFGTENHFAGGQVGLQGETSFKKFSLDAWVKGAVGNNSETVNINGSTAGAPAAGPSVVSGGFLALPSNSGHFTRNVFTVVPEAGMSVAYRFTENFRVNAGYSFLYLNDVIRPGNQVDTTINFSQQNTPGRPTPPNLVGDARPAFEFHDSSFWAQGVTAGLEIRW